MVCAFGPEDKVINEKVFLEDATAMIKNLNAGISTLRPVKRETILINSMMNGYYYSYVVNKTIMHKIVHWLLYGPAIQLAGVWNREHDAMTCHKQSNCPSRFWAVIDWME